MKWGQLDLKNTLRYSNFSLLKGFRRFLTDDSYELSLETKQLDGLWFVTTQAWRKYIFKTGKNIWSSNNLYINLKTTLNISNEILVTKKKNIKFYNSSCMRVYFVKPNIISIMTSDCIIWRIQQKWGV
jgi:hypothetical protein